MSLSNKICWDLLKFMSVDTYIDIESFNVENAFIAFDKSYLLYM